MRLDTAGGDNSPKGKYFDKSPQINELSSLLGLANKGWKYVTTKFSNSFLKYRCFKSILPIADRILTATYFSRSLDPWLDRTAAQNSTILIN